MSGLNTPFPVPSSDDFRAAELVVQATSSHGNDSAQRGELLQKYAKLRTAIGADRFDLLFGLRAPRTRSEQLTVQHHRREISDDEFRAGLKADAERPIDREMLDAFHNETLQQVVLYGKMLKTIVQIATNQRDPNCWRHRETEVDELVSAMANPGAMWKTHIQTVLTFLAEVRSAKGQGVAQCGEYSGASAHILAIHVMRIAAEAWSLNKQTAERSRTDRRYLYATFASSLFLEVNFPKLPRANDLVALLELEHAAASKELRDRQPANTDSASASGDGCETKKPATSADDACDRLRNEWATTFELKSVTGLSESAIRGRINRASQRKHPISLLASDVRSIPDTRPGKPRREYRIRAVWPVLLSNVRKKS